MSIVAALLGVVVLTGLLGVRSVRAAEPDPPPTGPTVLGDTVTFHGRGYGHGVGMSQYGARGRALDGEDAATILAHYYQGTTPGSLTADPDIRVPLSPMPSCASCASPTCGGGSSARRAPSSPRTTTGPWPRARARRSLIDADANAASEPAFTRGPAAARTMS